MNYKTALEILEIDMSEKKYSDIAGQITINSRIAYLKYQVFTYAIYVLIASIMVIPCSVLLSLVIYRHL
jgi:hypothetical protein